MMMNAVRRYGVVSTSLSALGDIGHHGGEWSWSPQQRRYARLALGAVDNVIAA
jgi:hypothetical protein